MTPFKDYFWRHIRQGVFFAWVALCGTSIIAYIGMIIFLKDKQLSSSLNVAAYTVRESMQAGDWSLALGHLMKLEKNGPVFHIKLTGSTDDRANLTGPFGEKPFGIGSFCKEATLSGGLKLYGCMRIFGGGEIVTLFLFILLASGLFFIIFKMFRSKMLLIIGNISESLKKVRRLEIQINSTDVEEIAEIVSIKEYIFLILKEAEEASKIVAINQLSTQVAHDIRSPLTALDMVIKNLSELPEQKRVLVRNAVNRIRDIANNLLKHYRENELNKNVKPNISSSLIMSMLDIIISEKRTQYSDRSIRFDLLINQDAYSAFTDINTIEFKRMISNVINNSVESIKDEGNVIVSLNKDRNKIIIEITDTGFGMEKDIIDRFLVNPGSFGKKEGCGLGLKHAYSLIKSCGGDIKITSKINNGTTVSMNFPGAPIPSWFANKIYLSMGSKVIIFDDDISIHEVWTQRFNEIINGTDKIDIIHFSSVFQLKSYFNKKNFCLKNYTLFMDYEIINYKETGLDIIESLKLNKQAILVTSRYEESEIVNRCEKMNVSLLPKSMAALIPIEIVGMSVIYDAVLIDDDPMIHAMWKMVAQQAGKQLCTYFTFEEFMLDMNKINPLSPIYIDVNLQNGIQGDVVSKNIFSFGFKNINLTTGYERSSFLSIPWIKTVAGKEPPWTMKS